MIHFFIVSVTEGNIFKGNDLCVTLWVGINGV